jgi:hypothetical protein
MGEHFTIDVPCKKYVKAYLETQCGTPADLSKMPDLLMELRRCLKGKPGELSKKGIANYTESVKIIIPTRVFYRDGWELNSQNVLEFNRYAEERVKFFMRNFVALGVFMGMSQTESIREFQDRFGFDEQSWSFDSIKKDFYRNQAAVETSIREIRHRMKKIFLTNLSIKGTITPECANKY